jgi:hypothetical protein
VEAQVSQEAAEALYLATKAAVEDALAIQGLRKLTITASGLNKVSVRVAHDQRGPASPTNLRTAQLLAQAAGISFEIAPGAGQTKKGTIVSIQYAK